MDYIGFMVVGVIVGAVIGGGVMTEITNDKWRDMAVAHGCAEYVAESDRTEFVWKENEITLDQMYEEYTP